MFKKVGIVGLGLIGGSLCKALKSRCGVTEIVASNRSLDVLALAKSEGVIDDYSQDISPIFKGCDIVFICTPVDMIFEFAKKLLPIVGKECIITDVGSTKSHIYDQMKTLGDEAMFIGGHPMTGSEKFRYQASKEHLFENAYYILTPSENVPQYKIDCLKDTVTKFGAIPIVVSPYEHDYIVASISHVPHIIAAGLVTMVKKLDTKQEHMHTLAAGGFKDITRIASSSPEMWQSILFENKGEILDVLKSLENVIGDLRHSLEENDHDGVYNYFSEAREYRDTFAKATPGAFVKQYEISVDVLDKPGSIAIIAVLFSSNNINIKNMSIINSRETEAGALSIVFASKDEMLKSVELLQGMNYYVSIKD